MEKTALYPSPGPHYPDTVNLLECGRDTFVHGEKNHVLCCAFNTGSYLMIPAAMTALNLFVWLAEPDAGNSWVWMSYMNLAASISQIFTACCVDNCHKVLKVDRQCPRTFNYINYAMGTAFLIANVTLIILQNTLPSPTGESGPPDPTIS